MKKLGKILLWILFWYYLIPYYLLKRYVFHGKHRIGWSSLSSIAILVALFFVMIINTPDDEEETDTASGPKVHYVVKKVGKSELAAAKAKNKVLAKEESKKEDEYEKLKSKLDSQEEKQKEEAKQQAAKEQAAEKKAKKEAEKQSRVTERSSTTNSDSDNDNHSSDRAGSRGDMNTADSGKIVGNSNSHIYHVPGQAGYRMNSANAVYFDSEQDAINAGYRKAKR